MKHIKKETKPMKNPMRLLVVSVFALLMSIPMFAQTPEVSTLPITEPTDVGGTVLQPGDYMIRVLRSFSDRNKVQITNADRSIIYVSALTVPHALEPGEAIPNTTFVYYPAGEGMPRALRTWFAPNPSASFGGHDIVYEEGRAKQLARLAKSSVVSYQGTTEVAELDTKPLEVVTPEATVETYTYTPPPAPTVAETTTPVETTTPAPEPTPSYASTPEPTEPMTSNAPEPTTQVAEADTTPEMPQTASRVPLLALLGLISLAGAVAFRASRS
jgi:hypothetical protein